MSATLDKNFNITAVSSEFARYLGFSKAELLKKRDNYLYSDCDKDTKKMILRVVKSGKEWNGEIQKLDYNNEIKWLHSNIQPVFNDNFDVVAYTNIFHDISSKKKIEDISHEDGLTLLRRYTKRKRKPSGL